jgi:F-type H+-transporting ATPase subunit delta
MNAPEQVRHETVFDDALRRVAGVYAEALLGAAAKRQQAEEVYEEFQALVGDLFRREPQLEAFLASRAVGRDRKAEVLRQAFEGRCSEVFANFLYVLNDHDRLDALRAVAAAYRDLYEVRTGRLRVQVRSAVPLPDDQQDRLRQELREAFHKEPILETRVDPDLLGGLVVRVGDWLYDASVRTRLETIRNQLIERSSYEIQSGRDRFSSDSGN